MEPFRLPLDDITEELKQIQFTVHDHSEKTQVAFLPDTLRLVGVGTDAIVVQHQQEPESVYKVYAKEATKKLNQEYMVYQILGETDYYGVCYRRGENFLQLRYESGYTLYECLQKGIEIPPQVIEDVNQAIELARKKELNPRDIHLKNILMIDGRAKIIDVSEYLEPGNDQRWEYLAKGYTRFYPYIRGKKVPSFWIDKIKQLYIYRKMNPTHIFRYLDQFFQQAER